MQLKWSDICNFYIFSKVKFLAQKIFLVSWWFLIIYVSWQYCENFRNFEQEELVETCPKFTIPTDFCIICSHVYYWKKWIRVLTNDLCKTFCVYIITTNDFTLNHNKSLPIYFCVKRQAKKKMTLPNVLKGEQVTRVSLTHCRLNRLTHTIYWKTPVSILGTSGYQS